MIFRLLPGRKSNPDDETNYAIEIEDPHMWRISGLLAEMLPDQQDEESCSSEPVDIPLPNVALPELLRIRDFVHHYRIEKMHTLPRPLLSSNLSDYVQTQYASMMTSLTEKELYEIVMAANYMAIDPLFELGCAAVACRIRGRSVDEIRTMFGMER